MNNEEIRNQIESLRGELRALGNSFINLRKEDLRNVMGDQIRAVLLERSDRFFADLSKDRSLDERTLDCKREFEDFIDRSISAFKHVGNEGALDHLEKYVRDDFPAYADACPASFNRFADGIFEQLRSYFELSDRVYYPMGRNLEMTPKEMETTMTPSIIEESISPLASAWRISLLESLLAEDDGLAELGRKLGLKKGHVQFHIKVLMGAGLIKYDRKSRLYLITPKGSEAYKGTLDLVRKLRSL